MEIITGVELRRRTVHLALTGASSNLAVTTPSSLPVLFATNIATLKAVLLAEQAARRTAEQRASGAEAIIAQLELMIARCGMSGSVLLPSAAASR